jgi:hypothetical protein
MPAAQRQRPLSECAAVALGALTVYLKPKLAADASLHIEPFLRHLTARNFRASRDRLISDIRNHVGSRLAKDASIGTLPQLLDALSYEPSMAMDECSDPNLGQGFRQINHQTRPTAHDDETVLDPSEKGTGVQAMGPRPTEQQMQTGQIPTEMQMDESTDEDGYTNKSALSPANIGKNASGCAHVKGVGPGLSEDEKAEIERMVNDAVMCGLRKTAHDYGAAELEQMQRKATGQDSPSYFKGVPVVGKGPACDTAFSTDCKPFQPPDNYNTRLLAVIRDPKRPDLAAQQLAADQKKIDPYAKPSAIFQASGAGRIQYRDIAA